MTGEQNENYDDDFLDDFALDEDLFADEQQDESEAPGSAAPPDAPTANEDDQDDEEFALPDELTDEAADAPAPTFADADDAADVGPFTEQPAAAEDLGDFGDLGEPLRFDDDEPEAEASDPAPAGDPDEDDMLFEDHTQRIEASETFPPKQQFDEGNESNWDESALELDPPQAPLTAEPSFEPDGDVMGDIFDAANTAPLAGDLAAEPTGGDNFELEGGDLLDDVGESDFELDSETELEIVGGDTFEAADLEAAPGAGPTDGAGQEAFVVDEGSGDAEWQDDDLAAPDGLPTLEPVAEDGEEPMLAADEAAAGEGMQVLGAAEELARLGGDQATVDALQAAGHEAAGTADDGDMEYEYIGELSETAAGAEDGSEDEAWEALPGQSMDELAEVEEGGQGDHSFVPQLETVATAQAEEHDELYTDVEDDPEVVGGHLERRPLLRMVTVLAALLIVGLGVATLVLRPELFGLRFGPKQVEIVQLARPVVEIPITEPPMPIAAGAETPATGGAGATGGGTGGGTGGEPAGGAAGTGAPGTGEPASGTGTGTDPGTDPGTATGGEPAAGGTSDPGTTDPGTTDPGTTDPATGGEPGTAPDGPEAGTTAGGEEPATGPVVVPAPPPEPSGTSSWPVPIDSQVGSDGAPVVDRKALLRAGDDLMIGQNEELPEREGMAGLRPGSRAFAQLQNGNFFIGSVKAVNTEFVTLRVEDGGEISLARAQLARLTGLGTSDFIDLQKATSGFVRLTNNNRLVGSILQSIRDDHIILGTKSNRVMLPKTAINEIIETNNDSGVRIGTTSEEDAWLRAVSERELERRRQERETGVPAAPTGGGN